MRQVFRTLSFRGWVWIAVAVLYVFFLVCCASTVFPSKARAFDREPARALNSTRPLPQRPAHVEALWRPPTAVLGAFDII